MTVYNPAIQSTKPTINFDAFELVISFLEELPEKYLNMGQYGDEVTSCRGEYHCNSVCCVVGWLPKILGLDYRAFMIRRYENTMRELGITYPEYQHLFFSVSYSNSQGKNKRYVIERIKAFVESKKRE